VKSVHNTPIEGFWHWLREVCGLNMHELILMGKVLYIFNPADPAHVYVSLQANAVLYTD
jgi:hypothetical protein